MYQLMVYLDQTKNFGKERQGKQKDIMKNKQKKVMHLIATNFYGGPEKQIIEHLKCLNPAKYLSVVGSFIENGTNNEILSVASENKIPYIEIPMAGPLDFTAQKRLIHKIKEMKVDLLCSHGYKSCVMGWWAGKKCKIPVIAFSRGYTAENYKVAFYEWLDRKAINKVAGIVAVSEGQKKKLECLGVKNRKWVVHNSVNINKLDKERRDLIKKAVYSRLGIKDMSRRLIVTAGRLSPEKGHRYLIEAIAKINHETINATYVFCGEGICQKELINRAKQLKIDHRCVFPGFRKDLQDIFQAMDLLVLPSLTEGLPNVVLEAFACAKPVVATSVGGVPELVENNVNGVLVTPERPDQLANGIAMCLTSDQYLQDFGEAGYQKVKNEFNFEFQTKKLEAIYSEILDSELISSR